MLFHSDATDNAWVVENEVWIRIRVGLWRAAGDWSKMLTVTVSGLALWCRHHSEGRMGGKVRLLWDESLGLESTSDEGKRTADVPQTSGHSPVATHMKMPMSKDPNFLYKLVNKCLCIFLHWWPTVFRQNNNVVREDAILLGELYELLLHDSTSLLGTTCKHSITFFNLNSTHNAYPECSSATNEPDLL